MTSSGVEIGNASVLLAVADERSFSAAGRRLGVSGSAIGQAIRKIENALGVQLFLRTTRTVVLTDHGRKLIDDLRPSVASMEQAFRSAREQGATVRGRVKLHAPRVAMERFVLPILPQLLASNPGLEVELVVANTTGDLLDDGADVALRLGEVISQDTVAVRIGPDLRQFAVASPAFVAQHGRPVHPDQLLDFPCIGWRWHADRPAYEWEFHEDGKWFAVQVAGPVSLNDRQLVLGLTIGGCGIGFMSEDDTMQAIEDGLLVNLLEPWCAPFPGWHLCYPRQRFVSRAARAVIDAIREGARPSETGS